MNTCTTVPATGNQDVVTGAERKASFFAGNASSQGVEGTSSMPPSNPASAPLAKQNRAVFPLDEKCDAVARRPCQLLGFNRQNVGEPPSTGGAILLQRTDEARRVLRRADFGAEIHHRLGEVAGTAGWRQRRGETADFGFGGRQRLADCEKPRHDPLDVTVHRRRLFAECDGRNGGRGIGADARQFEKLFLCSRKGAAKVAHYGICAGFEIASAGVIAEPRPQLQDLFQRRGSQRPDRRPSDDKSFEVGDDGLDGRLLQHDF